MTREEFDCTIAGIMSNFACRQYDTARQFAEEVKTAFAEQETELAALRPLKPIAERVLAALAAQCYDGSYDERPVLELRAALDNLDAMSKTAPD